MKRKNVISNISYALKNIWRWDRAFYLYFIPIIPLRIVLPLLAIYFPKVLIDKIQRDVLVQDLCITIIMYFMVLYAAQLVQGFCDSRLCLRQYKLSLIYQDLIDEKHMRTDYCNTDDPEINMKYSLAMDDACSGQCAPEFIWYSFQWHYLFNQQISKQLRWKK